MTIENFSNSSRGNDDVKFVDLNLDKTKLVDTNPTAKVFDSEISKKMKNVELLIKIKIVV